MKRSKILLPLIVLTVSACSSVKPFPQDGGIVQFATDFRVYAENGFTFSPFPPDGIGYLGVGLITTTITPEIFEVSPEVYASFKNSGSAYMDNGKVYSLQAVYGSSSDTFWAVEIFDQSIVNELIRDTYNKAVDFGANGIYDFKIQSRTVDNIGLTYYTYEVSGYAVRK